MQFGECWTNKRAFPNISQLYHFQSNVFNRTVDVLPAIFKRASKNTRHLVYRESIRRNAGQLETGSNTGLSSWGNTSTIRGGPECRPLPNYH